MDRYRWIDLHDERSIAYACDRRRVSHETEIELIGEQIGDRVSRNDQKERMAVGGRTRDGLGGDIARGARPVLDDEWLAEALRQPLTEQAREDVGRAAGGKANHDAYWPRGIGLRRSDLRPSDLRHRQHRGSARGEIQECAAGKFHKVPPSVVAQCALGRFQYVNG